MTCIVAVKKDNRIYMGGDSASVDTGCLYARRTLGPKVFKNGSYLIGYTSSFRMGHILQYKANFPEPTDENITRFIAVEFIDYIRQLFKDNGYAKISNARESAGVFIVGINGHIFEIDEDYHANEYIQPYISVGCGREYALGVCHALYDTNITLEDLIEKALKAAEEFSIGVKDPFHILEL